MQEGEAESEDDEVEVEVEVEVDDGRRQRSLWSRQRSHADRLARGRWCCMLRLMLMSEAEKDKWLGKKRR
jgi:hypothetical protein